MKQLAVIFALGFTTLFYSCCKNKDTAPSQEKMIIGHWKAVNEDGEQMAPEWGFIYEESIKFYPDHSFAINPGSGADDSSILKSGTWKLTDHNTSIIFYSVMNDLGIIKRDTTKFSISFDMTGKMIWRNSHNLITNIRVK